MSKYLVIVESPTKARTISSILGKDYKVTSSMGHVIDLPANKISVDVENNFEPAYKVLPGKQKIINQLKKDAKGKKIVYLATDPDREGEAISWHIKDCLSKIVKQFKRVVFHEITDEALKAAFKSPGKLDLRKVDAQVARRVLDRLVGYSLSPILWKTIIRGLSAGRVQSIALKFVVEREKQISDFIPQTTYSIEGKFRIGEEVFKAKLTKYKGKKIIFEDKKLAESCIEKIKAENFIVKDINKKQSLRKPPPPHITSLLQQDAFSKLRYSAQRTMIVAQKLYEGTQIGEKSIGLITYMRTDSFHVSPKAKKETKEFIKNSFGEKFLATKDYRYKKKKGAQQAHEAIRPTSINRAPVDLKAYISDDEMRLYDLIWRRFLASLMSEAVYENTKAIIQSKNCEFSAEGRTLVFAGFLKAIGNEPEENSLPALEKDQSLILEDLTILEHTTKPPARYNDASLVRLLEEKGIGRPSTYAPIIYTLIKRNYTKREKRSFIPTDLGIKVCNLLIASFAQIMDENFTALMEEKLDEVENGNAQWNDLLKEFYPPFKERVEKALASAKKEVEYSDKTCAKCQARMVIKWSRRGRFLSCEKFPKCKYAESITSGVKCPGCEKGELIERRNRRGQNFYGCSAFPECRYTSRTLPDDEDESDESGGDS